MFSGIVEEAAKVRRMDGSRASKTITIESSLDHAGTKLGDSICIDGVCLTVVKKEANILSFDISSESLRRSTLGALHPGSNVNLERSLVLGDRIHGHLVFGHVDSTVTLINRRREGDSERFEWRFPVELKRYLCSKGSVSISGVSLTVGEVSGDTFSVYAIPHTLSVTTLPSLQIGQKANLEVDMLARYVQASMQ